MTAVLPRSGKCFDATVESDCAAGDPERRHPPSQHDQQPRLSTLRRSAHQARWMKDDRQDQSCAFSDFAEERCENPRCGSTQQLKRMDDNDGACASWRPMGASVHARVALRALTRKARILSGGCCRGQKLNIKRESRLHCLPERLGAAGDTSDSVHLNIHCILLSDGLL